ncbi:MAG: right-handed parallel beta-helix repeat-containing protein [Candidatus Omnitrophica bacterium]|nr:right-handed parallel beta-helix repeat-containing protein [Candidatus Omnitrophota bacterium]
MPDSFCIDSGALIADVTEDFEGNPRPILSTDGSRGDGSGYDIGAFEFTGVVDPNLPPDQPSGIAPEEGATGELPIPTLTSSPFSDPDGDAHAASEWRIDDDSDFSSPEYDSGPDSRNLLSIRVPRQRLQLATLYHGQVRHQDQAGGWSEWSESKSFTTLMVEGIVVPEDYPTIQAAIDAATDGNTVTVMPGDYEEVILFHGKNIRLTSVDPKTPAMRDQTALKGIVIFSGTETEKCVLEGFTITESEGVYSPSRNRACKPTIQYNAIVHNDSVGIADCHGLIRRNRIIHNSPGLHRCNGVIEENEILSNVNAFGGAFQECGGTIRRNYIADNVGAGVFGPVTNPLFVGRGGGFFFCNGLIESNIVVRNRASEDGAAFHRCGGTIRNNTIVNNPTQRGQSVFYSCKGSIWNNIIYQGEGVEIEDPLVDSESSNPSGCLIQGLQTGGSSGNFDLPPLFVDELADDYRLQPHSPCIDRGGDSGATEDYDGNPRGVDGTSRPGTTSQFDIGAFEYQGPYVQAGDLSGNGIPDPMDLFIFQKDWMETTNASVSTHMNWDEKIDALDLVILMRDWLKTIPGRPYEK